MEDKGATLLILAAAVFYAGVASIALFHWLTFP